MEEVNQSIESKPINHIIEENKDNKPEMEKSDSVETDETVTEQVEDVTEDIKSEIENEDDKTGSECSEHTEDDSDDASVILEREEGDGQESTPNRKVDDDEDKRNPQYIPKRGTFYEHDDRTAVEEEGEEGDKDKDRTDKETKKKIWLEKEGNRWSHDRFNDTEQAPKSRAELVSIYGYDIRNEEGPPRARRRRRYGRGPNKYTRNWEDEEAYSKPTNVSAKPTPRKPRRAKDGEEFPPLEGAAPESPDIDTIDTKAGGDFEIQDSGSVKAESISSDSKSQEDGRNPQPVNRPQRGARNGPRRDDAPKIPPPNNTVRGVTKTRGFFKNGRTDSTRSKNQKNQQRISEDENTDYIMSQNFTNKSHHNQQQNVQKLEKDMANMSMQHQEFAGPGRGGRGGNNRQASVPPRLQAEQRGSKRYSSLRQRSLPETAANPQYPQFYQGSEFPPEYAEQPSGSGGLLPHPPATGTSVPLNGAAQLIQGPYPQYAQHPPHPQPAAFLPPVQGPVQPYLAQQPPPPPQILNFAQPPPAYPQPTYTNFQHQQFTPVPQGQPAELYQPQGGITYYSPQSQQALPRVPPKRVKSAIPIVPPPEHKEPRGRGRFIQDGSQVGSVPEDMPHEVLTAPSAPVAVQQ